MNPNLKQASQLLSLQAFLKERSTKYARTLKKKEHVSTVISAYSLMANMNLLKDKQKLSQNSLHQSKLRFSLKIRIRQHPHNRSLLLFLKLRKSSKNVMPPPKVKFKLLKLRMHHLLLTNKLQKWFHNYLQARFSQKVLDFKASLLQLNQELTRKGFQSFKKLPKRSNQKMKHSKFLT